MELRIKANKRKEDGFTIMFALILCIIFSSLLFSVLYFLKINTKHTLKEINKLQAIYLAESGNNRAMARVNIKSYPEVDDIDIGSDDDDDELFDDFDDDDFDDDDFFDDFDDEFDDDEFEDDFDDEDEKEFLAQIPRYINFYHKDPLFVNIDSGQIISESAYYSMVQQQQQRIQFNRQEAQDSGEEYQETELLVEELYFPLPEVNVKKIGSFNFKKGTHLKPGMKLLLAEKVPVDLKQKSIIEEFYNYVPDYTENLPKPKLRAISPNYAAQGEYLDVFIDGDNIDELLPEFGSSDITLYEGKGGIASIEVGEKAKPGRINFKIGPGRTDFFIVPRLDGSPPPIIHQVLLPKMIEGQQQFIKIANKEKVVGLKITGENLSVNNQPPIIVPDAMGIKIELVSYSEDQLIINVETKRPIVGNHYFSIFTGGGQSSSWIFNVEQSIADVPDDPFVGTYSTVMTLLEVNSLSNLPIRSLVEAGSGRPSEGSDSGRPGGGGTNPRDAKKSFDLLRSDLELVWQVETIATVNKVSYKEVRIIRRTVPIAEAALVTNSELSFGQSSVVVEGRLEALTRLEDSSSSGEKVLIVEGKDPDKELFEKREEEAPLRAQGTAVVEDFGAQEQDESPSSRGFTKGGIISVVSLSRSNSYTDFSIIESLGDNTITVTKAFTDSHYIGDEVIQFTPSVITPERVRERDAQRSLDPPGSVANLPGKVGFDYVFKTKLEKLIDWSDGKTSSTTVPDSLDGLFEGYFGLSIIEGTPSYSGGNALYGQGALIIDTTLDGTNPSGGTVSIGGGKIPSVFEGVIYIIGNLRITGQVEIAGSIIVNSPSDRSTLKIGGSGFITYDENAIKKSIIHLPFTEELRTRSLTKAKGQEEILQGVKNEG